MFLVRIAQYKDFKTEIHSLFKHKRVELNSRLYKLRPIFDEQDSLLRITGRAPSSSLIVLPKKSRISELLVLAEHKAYHHLGTVSLMARIEDRGFYLCGGRNEYKRCTACCNCRSPRRLFQVMDNLPLERFPTTHVGHLYIALDFCGHFEIVQNGTTKKCWILTEVRF